MTAQNSGNQQLSKEDEFFLDYVDDVTRTLLNALSDTIVDRASEMDEIISVTSREIRNAVEEGLARFHSLRRWKKSEAKKAEKANGGGWRVPTDAEAATQKKSA